MRKANGLLAVDMKTQRPDWEEIDWQDLIPLPGSFVSAVWSDVESHGRIYHAANGMHADYLWLKDMIRESGEDWARCCHCNQPIRYAVIFRDEAGRHHLVGQDCAGFLGSRSDRPEWLEKRRMSEIKTRETGRGTRSVLTIPCPPWFWSLGERPEYTSCFKGRPTGRQRSAPWYLSIWGDQPGDVIRNYEALQALRKAKNL